MLWLLPSQQTRGVQPMLFQPMLLAQRRRHSIG